MKVSPYIPTPYNKHWTEEQDQQVKDAILIYNQEHKMPFPEDPFAPRRDNPLFSHLKTHYLPALDRNSKQIRERWLDRLSPKLKHKGILPEHKDLVEIICDEKPGNWTYVAREIFETFDQKFYYSSNMIKSFYNQVRKDRVWQQEEEPQSKRCKTEDVFAKYAADFKKVDPEPDFSGFQLSEKEEKILLDSIINQDF